VLSGSDSETATQSRERRRVALVCRELSNQMMSDFRGMLHEIMATQLESLRLELQNVHCKVDHVLGTMPQMDSMAGATPPTLAWCSFVPVNRTGDAAEILQPDPETSPLKVVPTSDCHVGQNMTESEIQGNTIHRCLHFDIGDVVDYGEEEVAESVTENDNTEVVTEEANGIEEVTRDEGKKEAATTTEESFQDTARNESIAEAATEESTTEAAAEEGAVGISGEVIAEAATKEDMAEMATEAGTTRVAMEEGTTEAVVEESAMEAAVEEGSAEVATEVEVTAMEEVPVMVMLREAPKEGGGYGGNTGRGKGRGSAETNPSKTDEDDNELRDMTKTLMGQMEEFHSKVHGLSDSFGNFSS